MTFSLAVNAYLVKAFRFMDTCLKKVNDTPSAQDQLPIYWPGIGTRLVLTDKMRFADASGRCLSVVPHQFWTC